MAINNNALLTVEEWNYCYPGVFTPVEVKSLGKDYCPTVTTMKNRGVVTSVTNQNQCFPLSTTQVATSKLITCKVMESLSGPVGIEYINFWNYYVGHAAASQIGLETTWDNVSNYFQQEVSLYYTKEMILDTNYNIPNISKPCIEAGTLGANRSWYISDTLYPGWRKIAEAKELNHVLNYWIVDEENYTQDNPDYGGKVRPMTYGEWFQEVDKIYIYITNTSDDPPSSSEQVNNSIRRKDFNDYIPNPYINSGTTSADVASVIGEWDEDEDEASSTEATEPTTWSLRRGVSMDETQVSVNTVEELTEEFSDFKPKYEVNLYPNGYYEIVEIDYSNDNK